MILLWLLRHSLRCRQSVTIQKLAMHVDHKEKKSCLYNLNKYVVWWDLTSTTVALPNFAQG